MFTIVKDYIRLSEWATLPHVGVSRQRAYQWYKAGRLPEAFAIGSGRPDLWIKRTAPRPEAKRRGPRSGPSNAKAGRE